VSTGRQVDRLPRLPPTALAWLELDGLRRSSTQADHEQILLAEWRAHLLAEWRAHLRRVCAAFASRRRHWSAQEITKLRAAKEFILCQQVRPPVPLTLPPEHRAESTELSVLLQRCWAHGPCCRAAFGEVVDLLHAVASWEQRPRLSVALAVWTVSPPCGVGRSSLAKARRGVGWGWVGGMGSGVCVHVARWR
jgi:hypothetical protein